MTRFDEQPSLGFEAKRLLAGLVVLFSGLWLGESLGRSSGWHLIAGIIGCATAAALCWVFAYGKEPENEGGADQSESKLLVLVKVGLGVGVIGFIVVQATRRFAAGLTYEDSTGFGFGFGVIVIGAVALWRDAKSSKRHQSA